jgi:hypothetical protein
MSIKKAITGNPVNNGNAVAADGLNIVSLERGVGDNVLHTSPAGSQFTESLEPTIFKDINALAVGTIATAWTPATDARIRFLGGDISMSASGSLLFEDNAAASSIKYRTPVLPANQPYVFRVPGQGMLLSAINNVLKVTGPTGVTITGTIWGIEE